MSETTWAILLLVVVAALVYGGIPARTRLRVVPGSPKQCTRSNRGSCRTPRVHDTAGTHSVSRSPASACWRR